MICLHNTNVCALIAILGTHPELWNTGVRVTVINQARIYSIIRTMLSILTFSISAFFSCLTVCAAQNRDLPVIVLPVFIVLIFGTIIVSVIRLIRNR